MIKAVSIGHSPGPVLKCKYHKQRLRLTGIGVQREEGIKQHN